MVYILNKSVIDVDSECIVNAANCSLVGGGGVDGAIHAAAGSKLDEACAKIGHCDVGQAVITPGFNLKADYIIHTVGPVYTIFEKENCEKLLRDCYKNSLDLARDNGIHSIGFPCISCGVYGYPIEDASKIAIDEVYKWIDKNNCYKMDITLACYSKKEYEAYINNQ